MTTQELKDELATLKSRISVVEKELEARKDEWPKVGDPYLFIGADGKLYHREFWTEDKWFNKRRNFLGIFPDTPDGRARAEKKLALVKALCPANYWQPKIWEHYWTWTGDQALERQWVDKFERHEAWSGVVQEMELVRGNIHPTRKDAEAYGKALMNWADELAK